MFSSHRICHSSILVGSIMVVIALMLAMPTTARAPGNVADTLVPPNCPTSMTHYWKFNELAGPPYLDFYAGNDATCTNCPPPAGGIVGGSLDFDGVNDEVNVLNDGSWDWGKDDSFSIAYWMKTSASTAGNRVIVARDDLVNSLHWWVGCDNSGRVRFQLQDNTGTGAYIGNKGIILNDGAWHLVVAVRDNGADMNRIYVDAAAVDSAFHDYTAGFSGTADLNIGYLNLGGHYRFDGIVDEVATFNKALTDTEIQAFYNDGLAGIGYCGPEAVPPTIISTPDTETRVGDLYAYDVDAVGSPAPTYQLTVNPAGMTIDANSGLIQWTSASAGNALVTVEASNSAGTDDQSFTIFISEPLTCPDDMISYWKLDETSGSAYDDHFNGNDGQALVSAPTPSTGIVGGAQDFNGSSDRITVDDDPSLDWSGTQSFTVELWAKFTNVSGQNRVMIGRDDGGGGKPHWWLGAQQNSGEAMFVALDSNGNGTFIIGSSHLNDGNWHHMVGVKDESVDQIRVYVDGVEENSATHNYTASFAAATTLGIGYMAYGGTPNYFYDGELDEIGLYDRALSDTEIQQHHTNGLAALGHCSDDPVPPVIVSAPVTNGAVGIPYTYDVDATGIPGPNFMLTAAPAAMTIDSISGEIQWTPSTSGSYGVTVEAYNTGGTDSQSFTIDIPAIPIITSLPVTDAVVGQLYTYDVDATGVPVPTYGFTTNPAGMTIDTSSGLIEWTPSAVGVASVTVTASNSEGSDDQSFSINVAQASTCPDDMISYWKLDEITGTAYDDAYNGNDGQALVSPPTPAAGIVGGAQDFNGTTDRITVNDDPSLDWAHDQSFTVELWAKFTNVSSRNKVMIGRDDGGGGRPHWWIGAQQNTGKAMLVVFDANNNGTFMVGSSALNNDVWHHIVGVKAESSDYVRLYIDGAPVDSSYHNYTGSFAASTTLGIGYMAYAGTPDYFYDGLLDEIALYGRALSDAEINQHYIDGVSGQGYCPEGPVATLLQDYSARLLESHVMVEWELFEAGTDMRFAIHKEVDGRYQAVLAPEIERADLSFRFKDSDVHPGTTYRYRVDVTDEEGERLLFETDTITMPAATLTLYQNHPNPFNPETSIRFVLPEKAHTSLSIFDARGRHVATLVDDVLSDGIKSYAWKGKDSRGNSVGSGVYFYRLKTGNRTLTKKMLLIK